jgi:ribosomal protein S18 acetylase RimI-like enzyme
MTHLLAVNSQAQIDKIASLAYNIWNEHYPSIIGREQVDYMITTFQSATEIRRQIEEGYAYYLIEHQGQTAGYLALAPDPLNRRLQLSKLYIDAGMRGQGIGKDALMQIKEMAGEQGYETLWLTVNKHNADAIKAYESMGFITTGSLVTDIGNGFVMDDYKMEIQIPDI